MKVTVKDFKRIFTENNKIFQGSNPAQAVRIKPLGWIQIVLFNHRIQHPYPAR